MAWIMQTSHPSFMICLATDGSEKTIPTQNNENFSTDKDVDDRIRLLG